MSPEQARREARQLFGGVDQIKDDVRDAWLTRFVETVLQDVRYGWRGLRKHRGYAWSVIATMALGIGANSAIFSVVNAVVLEPLPYARGNDLVVLHQSVDQMGDSGFSIKDIDDIAASATTLDAVVEYHNMYFILLGGDEPARVATGVVSWNYFDTLGVAPIAGRTFQASDDAPGAPATLMLSYDYWTRAFNRDPNVVGRVFRMNDRPHTVVGVLPNVPMYPMPNDVYMPRSACPFRMHPDDAARRGGGMAGALGRRKPGVDLEPTLTDLAKVSDRLVHAHPDAYPRSRSYTLTATSLRRDFTRDFESTLIMLLGTSAFVLLIVCASVGNLSVARTMRLDRELALRSALGATHRRLLRQLLTENLILSLTGGAAGLLVAYVGMTLLVGYAERFTPRASEIRIDTTVLLFTLALAMLTGLAAAAIPALSKRVSRGRAAIYASSRTAVSKKDLRRALIVAQIAASFMLLIGAGLMLRSLWKLTAVDPGFRTDHVLTMQIDIDFSKYATPRQRAAYLTQLLTRLRRVPGVDMVGAGGTIPFLERSGGWQDRFLIEGRELTPSGPPRAAFMLASDDYFRTMDIPIVKGRYFTAEDTLSSPRVTIVNQAAAEKHWPNADPIGQRISTDGGRQWRTVVGVVGSIRQQLALEPASEIYAPMTQIPYVTTNWTIRSKTDPEALEPLVREAVRDLDPEQPIHQMRPLDDVRFASLSSPRLTTTLLGLFAALALVITAAGIAGVVAFSVSQRTHEFGVRVAFGARRADVVSMVLGEGLRLAVTGLVVGACGAVVLGGLLSTMLFGIQPTDAVTYVAVSSMLLGVAALACLAPALRAASVDPLTALRTT
jgi:predicted permease